MGRSRGTWGLKKGDLGVQACIFIDFKLISGPHFESFSIPLESNRCLFSGLFPGHFFKRFWGLNLDAWGFINKHLVLEVLQKPSVTEVGILMILRLICEVFWVVLVAIFMIFSAWRQA